jgi:galactokinase
MAAFEKQFPNLTDGFADSVPPAEQLAWMAIVKAKVRLLNAEAKFDARRARCEAAKSVLKAASEEAMRYVAGSWLEPNHHVGVTRQCLRPTVAGASR